MSGSGRTQKYSKPQYELIRASTECLFSPKADVQGLQDNQTFPTDTHPRLINTAPASEATRPGTVSDLAMPGEGAFTAS